MDAKLVSMDGVQFWRMPEGTFLGAGNNRTPWTIWLKTPEGIKPLRQ